jgi:hypothetical protein
MALLLSINAARAQGPAEALPPPAGTHQVAVPPPSSFPQYSVDQMHHEEHEEHQAEGGECNHEEGRGLFVLADFLYVRPRRRALDFAISTPVLDNTVRGKVESLDWETNGAYRVGAGYGLGQGWEVGGTYFYLHSKDNRALTAGPGAALFATLTAPGIDQASTAVGSTNVDMDIIDIDVAKRIETCNDHLTVRLSAGGRYASIQQKLFAAYTGGTAGAGALVSSPISFDGIGVETGGEAWFKVWRGVGIYAKAKAALMTGNFRTRLTQTINGGTTPLIDVTDKYTKVVPVSEMGLGVAWQSENIRVSVGYEIANFFNMVDSVDFVNGQSFGKIQHRQSDLSYDGLAVSVGLFF